MTLCYCQAYKFPHRVLSGKCDGWWMVQEAFRLGTMCNDCAYLHCWNERHAPGYTEALCECRLGDGTDKGDTPRSCPVVEKALERRRTGRRGRRKRNTG